jgi:multiple sugar transport system substrate-binding protein
MSRRTLATRVFVGATALAALVACGQAPAPTSAPAKADPKPACAAPTVATGAAPSAATVAPAAAKPGGASVVELRVHDWLQDPNNEFYGPFWKTFEEKHPNIKIKPERYPHPDMHTKQMTLAATGQLGDVVRIIVAPYAPELMGKGVIQALSPFIAGDKAWSDYDQKQIWPAGIGTYSFKGQQWGFPVVGHPGQVHHYLNVDLITKAGGKVPDEKNGFKWTNDDALAMYKAVTASAPEGTHYGVMQGNGNEAVVGVLRRFGGDYYDGEGAKCMIDSPESVAGLDWIANLYKTKVEIPFVSGNTLPDPAQVFPTEKVATVCLTLGFAALLLKIVGDKFKYTIVPPPIGPTGKFATQFGTDGIGLAKSTKYPAEAWEVVKAYAGKDHGLGRFSAGLGSPGARYDIWTAPEFKAKVPLVATNIYDTLVDPAKAPPVAPWHMPANGRYFEAEAAMTNILQDVWLGSKKASDGAAEAKKAIQAIMDKPPA